jgi:aspartate/methionine/tyrosine aminotransferase
MQAIDFNSKLAVSIITSPNNPDGSEQYFAERRYNIWDAAYASPVYGWSGKAPNHDISVWSAAKMYGVSGLRVGWLVTNDERIAAQAALYVEKTTSGVANISQSILTRLLYLERQELLDEVLSFAREDLLMNGATFNDKIAKYCEIVEGAPNGRGMFAWFYPLNEQAFDEALIAAKVKIVPGHACGRPGWIRMSMGQTVDVTRLALEALAEQLVIKGA